MKACKEYYCAEWDSDEYGGHCMLLNPKKADCENNQILDDYSFEEADSVEQYEYVFPECESGDEVIKIIEDGEANGFKFSVKGGKIDVKNNL